MNEFNQTICLPVGQLFLFLLLSYLAGGAATLVGGRALQNVTNRGIFVIFSAVILSVAVGLSIRFDWTLYGSLTTACLIAIGPLSMIYLARRPKGGEILRGG